MQACLEASQEASVQVRVDSALQAVNFDRNLNFRRSKRFVRQTSGPEGATETNDLSTAPQPQVTIGQAGILLDTSKLDELLNESSSKLGASGKGFGIASKVLSGNADGGFFVYQERLLNNYFKAPSPEDPAMG